MLTRAIEIEATAEEINRIMKLSPRERGSALVNGGTCHICNSPIGVWCYNCVADEIQELEKENKMSRIRIITLVNTHPEKTFCVCSARLEIVDNQPITPKAGDWLVIDYSSPSLHARALNKIGELGLKLGHQMWGTSFRLEAAQSK